MERSSITKNAYQEAIIKFFEACGTVATQLAPRGTTANLGHRLWLPYPRTRHVESGWLLDMVSTPGRRAGVRPNGYLRPHGDWVEAVPPRTHGVLLTADGTALRFDGKTHSVDTSGTAQKPQTIILRDLVTTQLTPDNYTGRNPYADTLLVALGNLVNANNLETEGVQLPPVNAPQA